MINLHVMNYDEHGMSSFIENPFNGLERFLQEWHHFGEKSNHIYMHINDLNHLNRSISIEYKESDDILKGYFEFIDFQNEDEVSSLFSKLIKLFNIDNIIFHYNKRERLDYISYIKDVNKVLVLHDAMLFSESGGFSDTDDYEKIESLNNILKDVDNVIAVSQFIYNVACEFYPECKSKINFIENDLYSVPYVKEKQNSTEQEKLKLVILGNVTVPIKGSQVIHELVTKDKKNDYHVLGRIAEHENKGVFKSVSEYDFKTLPEKIKAINPDIVIIPSMWDEAFGFTALEATYLGYPVLCFNVGDLKRVEQRHLGFVVNEKTSEALYQKIRYLGKNQNLIVEMNNKIKNYLDSKTHNSIQEYEQLLIGDSTLDLETVRNTINKINMEYGQYVHLNKIDKHQYFFEKQVLEQTVSKLQEEIRTYLKQLSEYNQLHESDVEHNHRLNDEIKRLEIELGASKDLIREFELKNEELLVSLKATLDYRVKQKIKKIKQKSK